jgi:Zn-dependent protease with chaperone function
MTESAPALTVDYFDGRSARPHRAVARVESDRLSIEAGDIVRSVPLRQLQWPERTRHGARLLHLPDGGSLQCNDAVAWDAWASHATGGRESLVVRVQQRWRWTLASLLAIVLILGAGYRWGLPLAADVVVSHLPRAVDESIGEAALSALDERQVVGPSKLPAAQRRQIEGWFSEAVARLPAEAAVPWRLEFRSGRDVGANAFALPGGAIVVTDELVERVHGDRAMLLGVLGHELGHLQHRHGMHMLFEAAAISAAAGALYGDFSSLLAVVPTWLAQAKYSRDAEREADLESVHLLRACGLSPGVMAEFFTLLRQPAKGEDDKRPPSSPGLGLASHPADDERIAFFRQAAEGR